MLTLYFFLLHVCEKAPPVKASIYALDILAFKGGLAREITYSMYIVLHSLQISTMYIYEHVHVHASDGF